MTAAASARPKPVIFDTDPGVDDAMALALIAASPALDLTAITTVHGNADVDITTRNALYLAQRFGLSAPVARGAAEPLRRARGEAPHFIHGRNGLGDVELTAPTGRAHALPAHALIIEQVRARPGEITLIAVGPLTNLALALEAAPDIAGLVAEVVIMGGAFGVAGRMGNVSPVAEANIHADPDAADRVLTAPWPVRMVGLDVTSGCVMSPAYMQRLRDRMGQAMGGVGAFLWALTRGYDAFYRARDGLDGFCVHDAMAVARAIDPSLFVERQGPVRVVTDGIAMGQTIQKPDGAVFPPGPWDDLPSQSVAIGVEGERFLALYADTLTGWATRAG